MKLRQYQVDAFATRIFEGNPAAVVPLDAWPEDSLLQSIAEENNLAETAFFVPSDREFHLRWFTPLCEVDLCGHATLASAHVLFEHMSYPGDSIIFDTRSGRLAVRKTDGLLTMDFPSSPPRPIRPPDALIAGLRQKPIEVLAAQDYIAVFENASIIRSVTPDHAILRSLDLRGVSVTAPGEGDGDTGTRTDFVSRFFAPKVGIPEDPVTGSVHCALASYWGDRLKKNVLAARQLSKRGGEILCELKGNRVFLRGQAVTFMTGEIDLASFHPLGHLPGRPVRHTLPS